jgi:uncharacterized membrane protein
VRSPSDFRVGHELEERIGRVLRVGVWLSSVSLTTGLAMSLADVKVAFAHWLLTAGLICLLATPASRVLVSVVSYGRSRDWLFTALTLIVLIELAASVLAAFHGRPFE